MCNPIHSSFHSAYAPASADGDAPAIGADGPSASSAAPEGEDPITEMAILLAKSFREDRKQARRLSDAAEAARFREAEQQVQAIREKASAIFSEGLTRGFAQMGGGMSTAVGGGTALSESAPIKAQAKMNLWSGIGDIGGGIGTSVAGGHARDVQLHQGEADAHASRAAAHMAASEKYRDEADEAGRMNDKVLEFLQKLNETRAATEGAAASIRG